ncbi:signal peptidase I [Neglectibacter timonensis]|uniref:signal peptidase I n=1 Tax=Neglectibacter timonensis TaxID=1776382 RepID=UPI00266DD3BA|nr:signal peptidase I [Neglectibacter timonensis]
MEWIEELVIAIVLIAVVFTFLFRIITVTGTSMIPNYNDGDRVLVVSNPLQISQGDVVVIINVLEEPIIKRVIATEGQTVDFDPESKAVLVNGQPVDETEFGLSNGMTDLPYTSFEILEFPQTVPEGCIFVLGDNRAVSEDSRYKIVGMIDERNILGKAVFNIFPFSKIGPAN